MQIEQGFRDTRREGVESRACTPSLWQAGAFVVKSRSAGETVDQTWPRHVVHLWPRLFSTPGQGPSRLHYRAGPSLAAGIMKFARAGNHSTRR